MNEIAEFAHDPIIRADSIFRTKWLSRIFLRKRHSTGFVSITKVKFYGKKKNKLKQLTQSPRFFLLGIPNLINEERFEVKLIPSAQSLSGAIKNGWTYRRNEQLGRFQSVHNGHDERANVKHDEIDHSGTWGSVRRLIQWTVVSCSAQPSLSYSESSEPESESEISTATLRAKIEATSWNVFMFSRSLSFCSIFSTLRNVIPENELPRLGE